MPNGRARDRPELDRTGLDWARPDQVMANSLQSYISQKPKATGKGMRGGRTGAKRKSQAPFSGNQLAAAISAAVVLGIQEEKKKKKKKASKEDQ